VSANPSAGLVKWWQRLHQRPGGKWLFARMLARAIPYTNTISPKVQVIEPGFARVELEDRRRVRNHLNSIHAIAIANLGELCSGLAITSLLPANVRGIPTALHIDYLKKARGRLVATSRCTAPNVSQPMDYQVVCNVSDSGGEEVATVTATWRLSPL
jgi:acyl-coenzyme A thioesterase PaaI-like protein